MSDFEPIEEPAPDDEVEAQAPDDVAASERTAYFSRFEPFEAEIVVELLRGAGIFATLKHDPTTNEHFSYSPILGSDRGIVLVDADRVAEARAVVDTELPKHLESIQAEMETIDVGEAEPEELDDEE